ncbi:sensor histidine kinase [Paenibacillus tengchongensis]|uniref:sensor histidine kinase n=1 Tax=Paenibacillus tengchongensis TaxID=2608684 RepID=UPI00124E9C7F|nr:histidine kinase [Paenibacillus tengchongensis]
MIRKVNMKRFIYFFVFFLLLTLSLFFVMNTFSSQTLQKSLIGASRSQISYAEGILQDAVSEAAMYGIQFTADDSIRLYRNQIADLDNYDAQMKKNAIRDKLGSTLITSRTVDALAIYWLTDETLITTNSGLLSEEHFQNVTARGWKVIGGNLYYFSVYPYIHPPKNPANFQYIVGVRLKPDYMVSLLQKAVNGDSSDAFFLVGGEQVIRNRAVDERIVAEARETLIPDPAQVKQFNYRAGRDEYYILSKYIEPIDTYLITYTRMNDFLTPLEQSRQVFLVSILAVLMIGLVVIGVFYRNFYRNVQLLGKKFRQVEEGNHNTRISENTGNEFQSLFVSFNHMVTNIQTLFASLKTETELRRDAEFKQLQAQINPHFLYNNLFFIMTVAQSSPDAVMRMSKHMAEYYRYITRLDRAEITLSSELELADHYLNIMALTKQITYSIDLAPPLAARPIMPLIIQPLVENAIQHGIEEQQGAHRISIEVKALETGALLTVADDGKGLTPEELHRLSVKIESPQPPEGSRGVGLWNVNRRLRNAYGPLSGLRLFTNHWGGLSVMAYIEFAETEGGHHEAADR